MSDILSSPPPKKNDSMKTKSSTEFSPIQIGMGLIIVGASAGLTLYTKKTGNMLSQMDKLNKAHAARAASKRKPGPITKKEYEKTRTRIDDDDLI